MTRVFQRSPVILASKSPRRRTLLEAAGINVTVSPSRIREKDFLLLTPEAYAQTLAEAKARDVAKNNPDAWVIGADSIVVIEGRILGKPATMNSARDMIRRLSGETHRVLTGYAIACQHRDHFFTDVVCTEVTFKPLTDEEVEWYIHTKEPYDKAGGYAIQGLGAFMVRVIAGSYTNVVGLPLCEVLDHLYKHHVISRAIAMEAPARAGNEPS
ncbi:MAG: Maf family protein [Desulfobacterales bacterium]